jgi:nucleotide-binding universal stress UspA family protein
MFIMSIHKILVAYDGSDCSCHALDWALTNHPEAQIDVLTVLPPLNAFYNSYTLSATGFIKDQIEILRQQAKEKMVSLKEKYAAEGKHIETILLEGSVVENLLSYSTKNDIELIVTGSRGAGGFVGLILGSTAHELILHAKVPVVVVR